MKFKWNSHIMGEKIFQLDIICYETEFQVSGMGCDFLSHWPKKSRRHSLKYHSLLPMLLATLHKLKVSPILNTTYLYHHTWSDLVSAQVEALTPIE